MSLIPQYGGVVEGMAVRRPGETQIGCVWCLKENTDAPAPGDIIYHWGGTSVCTKHMRIILADQEKK